MESDAFTEVLDPNIAASLLGDKYNSGCDYTMINMTDKLVVNVKYKHNGEEEEIVLDDNVPKYMSVIEEDYSYIAPKDNSKLIFKITIIITIATIFLTILFSFIFISGYYIKILRIIAEFIANR